MAGATVFTAPPSAPQADAPQWQPVSSYEKHLLLPVGAMVAMKHDILWRPLLESGPFAAKGGEALFASGT